MERVIKATKTLLHKLKPGYSPARHYMRGPGPACARRPVIGRPDRLTAH
ncbi:hypothetical protein SAMN05428963_104305 [Consotaella salsifontis]|uniref:Uncharacterized protein n=1 Tax=Consotaella salsifontis TaxID=1365950 RepID=A0A1T4Q2B2_9HYPH|nr:hypothetical protein SAMN05428963_104305 [Consotaella salsifontis]